jgi:hypothetical protein
LFLAPALAACRPSDAPRTRESHRGPAIVARAVEAHGGLARWRELRTLSARYRERWFWPWTWAGVTPWPGNEISATLRFALHTDVAHAVFDRWPGQRWRYAGGSVASEGEGIDADEWKPWFALPRTHFLTLLPFKFADATAQLQWLGRRDGLDEVLVTYPPGAGQTPEDRYWARFDPETGRLVSVALTVTAYGPLAAGDLRYENWQWVDGLLLPGRIPAVLTGPQLPLHTGEYSGISVE